MISIFKNTFIEIFRKCDPTVRMTQELKHRKRSSETMHKSRGCINLIQQLSQTKKAKCLEAVQITGTGV